MFKVYLSQDNLLGRLGADFLLPKKPVALWRFVFPMIILPQTMIIHPIALHARTFLFVPRIFFVNKTSQ